MAYGRTDQPTYDVANIELAERGRTRISWARANMPIVTSIGEAMEKSKPFENMQIGICLHVEAKTAVWLEALKKGGAEIAITGSPGTTQDDTAASLVADMGFSVFAKCDETYEQHITNCKHVLACQPDLIADNGGDLHLLLAHDASFSEGATKIFGATEETTTGARRIREKAKNLLFPTLVINDTSAKRVVENHYGVGSSVVDGIMRATNVMLHGKKVLVIGYGYCGSGIAQRLRGMGAHVTIVEEKALKALEAHLEGFQVDDLNHSLGTADLVITVTGYPGILGPNEFKELKDGAILANAGHFANEIDVTGLSGMAFGRQETSDYITAFQISGARTLYLLADANPINLAAGDGNPIEIMDLGLALQALSLARIANRNSGLPNGAQSVPADIEEKVAGLALKHWSG